MCCSGIPVILQRKLADFQAYYNAARSHASLVGHTPLTFACGHTVAGAVSNSSGRRLLLSSAPSLEASPGDGVEFQRASEARPLDDVIVRAHDAGGAGATLEEIQVKREITFAPADDVFADVVRQIAAAANRPDVSNDLLRTRDRHRQNLSQDCGAISRSAALGAGNSAPRRRSSIKSIVWARSSTDMPSLSAVSNGATCIPSVSSTCGAAPPS